MTNFTLVDAIRPHDLIRVVSGTTAGINWTIESVFERRAGFRLFVAGRHIATLPSPLAAWQLRDDYIAEIGQTVTAPAYEAEAVEIEVL